MASNLWLWFHQLANADRHCGVGLFPEWGGVKTNNLCTIWASLKSLDAVLSFCRWKFGSFYLFLHSKPRKQVHMVSWCIMVVQGHSRSSKLDQSKAHMRLASGLPLSVFYLFPRYNDVLVRNFHFLAVLAAHHSLVWIPRKGAFPGT